MCEILKKNRRKERAKSLSRSKVRPRESSFHFWPSLHRLRKMEGGGIIKKGRHRLVRLNLKGIYGEMRGFLTGEASFQGEV